MPSLPENASLVQHPHDETTTAALNEAGEQLYAYTIGFIINQHLAGSGTLVSVGDHYGILTAGHVAKEIKSDPSYEVSLLFRRDEHHFPVPVESFRVINFGRWDEFTEEGPDLALLTIDSPAILAELKRSKSFYPLGGRQFERFPAPRKFLTWALLGAPIKLSTTVQVGRDTILHSEMFFAWCHLEGEATRGDFDFLEFSVPSSIDSRPSCYKGLSGGGVWVTAPETDDFGDGVPRNYRVPNPQLAGVVFFQGPEIEHARKLYTHGPDSLYQAFNMATAQLKS